MRTVLGENLGTWATGSETQQIPQYDGWSQWLRRWLILHIAGKIRFSASGVDSQLPIKHPASGASRA